MKELVYCVYHDVNKEARSMELLKCCMKLGHVNMVTYAIPMGIENVELRIIDKASMIALLHFLRESMKVIKEKKPEIVVLHDNDCSVLIPYIKRICPNAFIIYDSSELYMKQKKKDRTIKKGVPFYGKDGLLIWIKNKLTLFRGRYEKKYLKEADLIFAANQERAAKMKEYFQLREIPEVFDNVHRIDDTYDVEECKEKFKDVIKENAFNVLFAGGISEERKTFDYIRSFSQLDVEYNLIIAGSASSVAKKQYEQLYKELNIKKNVHYIGFVSRAELRYLMNVCQGSVVLFDMDSFNTMYCESGKCYESLFESTPILASENPPLKRLCLNHKIGISNNNYAEAIVQLRDNYEYYQEKVREFVEYIDYDERLTRLTNTMLEKYNEKMF